MQKILHKTLCDGLSQNTGTDQVWEHIPIIQEALRRLMWENSEFRVSLSYRT